MRGLDPWPRVLDRDRDVVPVLRRRASRGTNGNSSASGELDRIAQEVDDHLAHLAGIARQRARHVATNLERELEAFVFDQLPEHQLHVGQQRA